MGKLNGQDNNMTEKELYEYVFERGDPLVILGNTLERRLKHKIASEQYLDFIVKHKKEISKKSHYAIVGSIYLSGQNCDRLNIPFNYKKAQNIMEFIIKEFNFENRDIKSYIDTGNKKTIGGLSGWKQFNHKQGWKFLETLPEKGKWLKRANQYWPIGIEQSDEITRKIKSGAKVMPTSKKLTLKEFINLI